MEETMLVIIAVCAIIVLVERIIHFIALPTAFKISEIKACLLDWVRAAEKELGGGTGKFKLSMVYDRFCRTYPELKKWFPLEKFEALVNDALKIMDSSFSNAEVKENALRGGGANDRG